MKSSDDLFSNVSEIIQKLEHGVYGKEGSERVSFKYSLTALEQLPESFQE